MASGVGWSGAHQQGERAQLGQFLQQRGQNPAVDILNSPYLVGGFSPVPAFVRGLHMNVREIGAVLQCTQRGLPFALVIVSM